MDVDGEALFSQPLMGHPVFTVFVSWTLARAGNTQRLKQLGGEDVLGMDILSTRLHPTKARRIWRPGVVGRDRER